MRRHCIFLVLWLTGIVGTAQQAIDRAQRNYESYAFKPAQDIYEKLLARGIENATIYKQLGNTYYFTAEYEKAALRYGQLLEKYKSEFDAPYYFRYAQALKSSGNLVLADSMMLQFRDLTKISANRIAELFDKNRDYRSEIEKNSGRYEVFNFPHNSEYADFAPSFHKTELLFASDRDTGNLARYRHTWDQHDFLDLYSAAEGGGGKLQKLYSLNTRFHESTSALSPDGKWLYFTRSGNRFSKKTGISYLQLYRSQWIDGAWSFPKLLSINGDDFSVGHPAISPDGKTLYFSSDRSGGLGGSDLWRVHIRDDGSLGNPEHLGPYLNTPARETFPFVTDDGILYFSSDGHPGLGGLDVFAIRISDVAYGGKILNVGRPINSEQDDFTFIISDSTHKGYFASNRPGGLGKDDIYGVLETKPLSFNCEQVLTGTVRDKITNRVLVGATVRIINEDNLEIASSITDTKGEYTITRDCDQGSFVRASREGYIASEEFLSPSLGKPRIIDFYLEPESVTAGFGDDLAKLLQLSTIYFDFAQWNIRPDAEIEIMKVITAMEKYPSLKIKVNSHTDSRGPDAYNLWLSQQRADATVRYMISKGISPDRLQGEGFGETKLINGCSNGNSCLASEHSKNRRSEFIILE